MNAYIMCAGATPKLRKSAIESNSTPNEDSPCTSRATRPSSASNTMPAMIA